MEPILAGLSPAGTKCGCVIGDYSRTSINTSINTGTVIGVCSNVFDSGLTQSFIPDFTWGKTGCRYRYDKAIQDITNWQRMKNKTFNETEKEILKHIFDHQ